MSTESNQSPEFQQPTGSDLPGAEGASAPRYGEASAQAGPTGQQYGGSTYGAQSAAWTSPKRLARPRDRMLGGVCAGIARQFDVDPTVVRVLALIALLLGAGSPVLVYLILWIVMPSD